MLRVHDVAAVADYLRVRAALRASWPVDAELALDDALRTLDSLARTTRRPLSNAAGLLPTITEVQYVRHLSLSLESSSLADLHEIASELGLDGFRRLRKADLVGAYHRSPGHQRGCAAA